MPLGIGVGFGPGDIVLDGDTVPNFSCMSVVGKRSPISATDGHLSTYLTEELTNSKILHCVNERSVYSTGKHVQ